ASSGFDMMRPSSSRPKIANGSLCILFVLAATLCSCTEGKQATFGSCRADLPSNRTDAGAQEFMDACMQSKGYGPAFDQSRCRTEPVCYKPVTALTTLRDWF